MTSDHHDENGPGAGSYVVAVLIPIVGVVLAIRQFARNRFGPATALLLTSIVSGVILVVALSAIGGASSKCLVTATGSKLCGDDAAAWCDSTDSLRQLASDERSQSVCDDIRGR
jgi:hypothetical protein